MKRTPLGRRTPLKAKASTSAGSISGYRAPSGITRSLKAKSDSPSAQAKDRIQALVREIVIIRDGGCILRNVRYCNGYHSVHGVVLQADHLITRANSATFSDTRLIVCLCRSCHAWKSCGNNARKAQYDALVRTLLPADRVRLWDRAEQDSWKAHRKYEYDWRLDEAALKQELSALQAKQ